MNITLKPNTLTVLCAPHAAREETAALMAELALRGAVTVLDGGNRFAAYHLMQRLRQRIPDPASVARRIFVRRAFTCYQMLSLLESTPPRPQPYILLDLLATFYDENVPLPETRRLLESCLRQVERLCQIAPLLATLAPPSSAERAFLVERVCERAGRVLLPELPPIQQFQLTLLLSPVTEH